MKRKPEVADVEVGSVWEEKDSRRGGRRVRVVEIVTKTRKFRGQVSSSMAARVKSELFDSLPETKIRLDILVDRFRLFSASAKPASKAPSSEKSI